MKIQLLLFALLSFGFASAQDAEVKTVETIETESETEVARLYKNKNSKVKAALSFYTKDDTKLA